MPTTPKTIKITVNPNSDSFASFDPRTLYAISEAIPLTRKITESQNTIIKCRVKTQNLLYLYKNQVLIDVYFEYDA